MAMEIKQQLRLSQQLVMTPQLQQAIKLLQLSRMELVDTVRQELTENPLLEDITEAAQTAEDKADGEAQAQASEEPPPGETDDRTEKPVSGDERAVQEIDWENYLEKYSMAPPLPSNRPSGEEMPSIESTLTRRPSLVDHLVWQLKLSRMSATEEAIGMLIIGNLNTDGYLIEPLDALAADAGVPVEIAEGVLTKVQAFDPVGVAARTLGECLLIQARYVEADDDLVVQMIERHLPNLEKKNYQAIAKDLHQPLDEINEAAKVISAFDPRPGRLYTDEEPIYITPDVYVHKVGEKYFVVPNDDGMPKLKISSFYRAAMADSPKAKEYIQQKLRSAQWLIRSIQQRQRTIVRVTESIIKFQREFLDKGIGALRPLILRDVAEDISMHESTISRVTTSKYVHTPQGIFELKYFFNSGLNRTDGDEIASESVKDKIRQLVEKEDHKHPYSDQRIVELLREQQIEIARRTVAKYREQLGILSSSKRRQPF
ncbi:MAG: RNA polymerase factor sigma-54 [Myxococcota bacterium]